MICTLIPCHHCNVICHNFNRTSVTCIDLLCSIPGEIKGAYRVGTHAVGLLLRGECAVELVLMCSNKPTHQLFNEVASRLPAKFEVGRCVCVWGGGEIEREENRKEGEGETLSLLFFWKWWRVFWKIASGC